MSNDASIELQANTYVSEVFCRSCGNQIKKEAEICPHCGVRQFTPEAQVKGNKSRIAAGLLALFLGGLGIHKFYMGQSGKGIVYLLFFWTFIPALLALVEGICILIEDDAKFARRVKA